MNDLNIRKLTPKECFRLMGFDDLDFEKAKAVNSDTQLYKQAGNSIVVSVLEAILTNLLISPSPEKMRQMDIFDFINQGNKDWGKGKGKNGKKILLVANERGFLER